MRTIKNLIRLYLQHKDKVDPKIIQKWQDMRFGQFIHWGIYSLTAGYWNGVRAKSSGHIVLYERIPVKEWGNLAQDFNPTKFYADDWILASKNAGMKYFIITTKHHDGLAMYDSLSSDFNIVDKSQFKRDPIKELAEACHKHGMKLGFYYSLGRDWEDPNAPTKNAARSNTWDFPDEDKKIFSLYFERKVKPQITELLTNYGEVDILWFDTPGLISLDESHELYCLIRSLQPNCIINSRIGNRLGDYKVREQVIGGALDTPWESCVTMGKHWNYDLDDNDEVYKSPELLVHQLIEISSKGGNYLLNLGPTAGGEYPEEARERLALIGKWMEVNGEGIYATKPWKFCVESLNNNTVIMTKKKGIKKLRNEKKTFVIKEADDDGTSKQFPPEVRFTCRDNFIYAFVCNWDKNEVEIKSLSEAESKIENISMLGYKNEIMWKQTESGLNIKIPDYLPTKAIPIKGFKIIFK